MTVRKPDNRLVAITVTEVLVTVVIFSVLMSAVLPTWITIQSTAVNTVAYSGRQNDQARVVDYLKRDIRRATKVELYNGATLVTGTGTPASELSLSIPDYYSDLRDEDNAIGSKLTNSPTYSSGAVAYGSALTVRYYALGGAVIRSELGKTRTIADSSGAFTLGFERDSDGSIRCRLTYEQAMIGGGSRKLKRDVDVLCLPRFELQL